MLTIVRNERTWGGKGHSLNQNHTDRISPRLNQKKSMKQNYSMAYDRRLPIPLQQDHKSPNQVEIKLTLDHLKKRICHKRL